MSHITQVLKITPVRYSLCVSTHQASDYYSYEMNPDHLVKQVMLLSGVYVQHMLSKNTKSKAVLAIHLAINSVLSIMHYKQNR